MSTPEDRLPNPAKPPPARRKREAARTHNQTANGDYVAPVGDKKCGANKADGSECTLAAGWGTEHPGYGPCKHHFGATPMGRKGAAYDMAGELMVFYGQPLDTNPIDALLDEVRRTAGHVAYLGQGISQFKLKMAVSGAAAELPPEADGWLRMYQSERAHLVRVSEACLRAGIEERLVQIAEHQGAKLADAVEQILNELNLTPGQLARVPDVVPRVLQQLVTGPPKLLLEGGPSGDHRSA